MGLLEALLCPGSSGSFPRGTVAICYWESREEGASVAPEYGLYPGRVLSLRLPTPKV